jgi:prepilin-type N-terminal cleavage/methylation domain-containing protein
MASFPSLNATRYAANTLDGRSLITMLKSRLRKRGFSLLELLAVVTILGIIAAVIIPRVTVSSSTAKQKVRDHHKATINAAVERFYIDTGTWPANNLSDIGGNANYFPDGIPTNPVDGSAYSLNATTHRVN